MIKQIVIREFGPTPGIAKRAHNRIMRSCFEQVGAWYHRTHMMRHFTREGAKKYNYAPRAGERAGIGSKRFFASYTGRKLREKGHTRPLVWSGASETLARIRDIRANSKRGRIVQHARGLNRKNPHSQVNTSREIRTVADDERREMIQRFGRHYREEAARLKATKTTRI